MKRTKKIGRFFAFLFLFVFCTPLLRADNGDIVRAYFKPSTLQVGEIGTYVLEVSGTLFRGPLNLPKVPGLELAYFKNSTSLQVTNGRQDIRGLYVFRTRARKAGTYTMPAYTVTIEGERYQVPAASLDVIPQGASTIENGQDPLKLALNLPRSYAYVGESIPVRLDLYARGDIKGNILPPHHPVAVGDAFMGTDAPRGPEKSHSNFGDTWYNKLTWEFALTPFKRGEYPLLFELGLAVQGSTKQRPRAFDPFSGFSAMFGDMMVDAQEVIVSTEEEYLEIRPLPEAGRPQNFTGAIGVFVVKALPLNKTAIQVGEPLTLTIEVTGEGNFDRIHAPELVADPSWKTYTPKTDFRTNDILGREGVKAFEYIVIPQESGLQSLPSLDFNFFDPDRGEYQDFTVQWPTLNIKEDPDAYVRQVPEGPVGPKVSTPSREDLNLLPIKQVLGSWTSRYEPLFYSPIFWLMQCVFFVALVGGAFYLRYRRRLLSDMNYIRTLESEASLKQHWAKANIAVSGSNTVAFAACAQTLLLAVFVRLCGSDAYALTWPEVESLLKENQVPEGLQQEVQAFFELSNAVRFGGESSSQENLRESFNRLERVVAQLKEIL